MLRLIVKEIAHRKLNSILSLLAVAAAVALFVGFFTTGEASKRETTRLMRDLGFNLRIIPVETDMERFWATGFSEHLMPESYVARFASAKDLSFNHLLATLRKRVQWQGREIILTGIAPHEVIPEGKARSRMQTSFAVEAGTAYVGYEIATALDLKKGDTIDLFGEKMVVVACLAETGSADDVRITTHLMDAQRLLKTGRQINEIQALECLCWGEDGVIPDGRDVLRKQLAKLLPEAKVVQLSRIAQAREKQRVMAEDYFAFIMPVAVVFCGGWVAILAVLNVRERRQEIGILRALGYSSGNIAFLFLGKAMLVGLAAGALGYVMGTALALHFGPGIFKVTAATIRAQPILLVSSVVGAPVFACVASFIPTVIAVGQDPAVALRVE